MRVWLYEGTTQCLTEKAVDAPLAFTTDEGEAMWFTWLA